MERRFLDCVAKVLGEDVSEISMDTTYGECPAWDSLMMLTLVMELEEEYGVSIPVEKLNNVHKLRDLYQLVK